MQVSCPIAHPAVQQMKVRYELTCNNSVCLVIRLKQGCRLSGQWSYSQDICRPTIRVVSPTKILFSWSSVLAKENPIRYSTSHFLASCTILCCLLYPVTVLFGLHMTVKVQKSLPYVNMWPVNGWWLSSDKCITDVYKVATCRAWLVLRWVNICEYTVLVCNQRLGPTHPPASVK